MKKLFLLSAVVAATLSAPVMAQSQPTTAEVSLTDLLHQDQYLRSTNSLISYMLYWSPVRPAPGAPSSDARCGMVPMKTDFPVRSVGSYAECMAASFPELEVVDDVSDVLMPPRQTPKQGIVNLSCTKGNFTGEVEVSWGRQYHPILGPIFVMQTHRYRITKRNGQQGGNKANLNIGTRTNQHSGSWAGARSPDNLVQNGQWYPLNIRNQDTRVANYYFSEVEFVFDKTGKDPKCKTGTNWMRP